MSRHRASIGPTSRVCWVEPIQPITSAVQKNESISSAFNFNDVFLKLKNASESGLSIRRESRFGDLKHFAALITFKALFELNNLNFHPLKFVQFE